MAIQVNLLANVRDFIRGTNDASAALDDVGDSLDDLAKDAAKDARKIGADLGDDVKAGARDAETAVDKLDRSFSDLARGVAKTSGAAGDDLKRNIKKGTDGANEGVREFGDEANSTAKEAAASFDGSAESIGDVFQELASTAFAGFGPAGAIAGVAVAVGLGTAITAGQEAGEALTEAKERAGELAIELYEVGGDIDRIDLGGKMREWGVEIADTKEFWEIWQESATTNLDEARRAAERFGVSAVDMFRGLSGYDSDAAARALEGVRAQLAEVEEQGDRLRESDPFGYYAGGINDIDGTKKALKGQIKELENLVDKTEDATAAQELMTEATARETEQAEALAAAEDARADAISSLQSGLDSAVGAYDEFANAETGALDPAGYIAGIQARIDATTNFNSNVQTIATQFGLTADEVQAILDQGVEFGPMLQSIIDSGLAPEFIAQIQAAVGGGQDVLDGSDLNATVAVDADVKEAESKAKDTAAKKREARVDVRAVTTAAEAALDRFTEKRRHALVNVSADLATADRQIDAFMNRRRSVRIVANVVDRTGKPVI